ncbi:MAG: hypothetical protein M3179_02060 [Actinomycetota bacterium]|nr:hypothetical protein [Actinomycetota bacterium]
MRIKTGGRRLGALALMVGSLGMALGAAAPAGAGVVATQEPQVLFVAPVVTVRGDQAQIIGVYRCFGGEPIHLWVSAKQGGPDPTAEDSGATSTSWYDTNIAGAPPVICDGRYHVATVPVGRYPNKAQLTSGQAWVQFCLVDENFGFLATQSKWARVIGP